MTATVDEIESALLAPWVSVADGGLGEWTATGQEAIAWDNVDFDPATLPAGTPWMEVSTSAGTSRRITVDEALYVAMPTVTIAAHTPIGTGKKGARDLIGAAATLYRGRDFKVGSSTMRAYAFSQPVELPRDGWFKLAMQVSLRLF